MYLVLDIIHVCVHKGRLIALNKCRVFHFYLVCCYRDVHFKNMLNMQHADCLNNMYLAIDRGGYLYTICLRALIVASQWSRDGARLNIFTRGKEEGALSNHGDFIVPYIITSLLLTFMWSFVNNRPIVFLNHWNTVTISLVLNVYWRHICFVLRISVIRHEH